MLISLRKNYDFVLEVFKTVSTRCSEIGPRCNELARVNEIVMLKKLSVASMELATMSRYGWWIVMHALKFLFGYSRHEALAAASIILAATSKLGLVSPWCWRALATASGIFASTRRLRFVNSKVSFGFYALFGWDREHSLQRGWFSLRRVGSGWEALVVDSCRSSELVYHCSEIVVPLQRVCISP